MELLFSYINIIKGGIHLVYDVFLNKIKTGMEQALGKEYELSLHRITKNNGLILDGCAFPKTKSGSSCYLSQ